MQDPSESTVSRILNLMRVTFGDRFKTYYQGDPDAIPTFNLPCLIVTTPSIEIQQAASEEDDLSDEIIVKLVLNKLDDYTGDKVDPLNLTDKRLLDLVIKRDLQTRQYDEKTVVGAIRKYGVNSARQDEGIDGVAPSLKIEFGINHRPTPAASFADTTAEAHVSFSIQYSLDTD